MSIALLTLALAAASPADCTPRQSPLECLLIREAAAERPDPAVSTMQAAEHGSVVLRYRKRVIELVPVPAAPGGPEAAASGNGPTDAPPRAFVVVESLEFVPVEPSVPAPATPPAPPRT